VKLVFRRPPRVDVAVLDVGHGDILERLVLEGLRHAVLPIRREMLWVSPGVLGRFLLNLRRVRFGRAGGRLLPQLYRIYLLSILERMAPKAVLTFSDDAYPCQWLCRQYRGGECFAIQNGTRSAAWLRDWLPTPPLPGSLISMPNLICFGQAEIDLYARFGHRVDRFFPAGSLKGGYYRTVVQPEPLAKRFDVCFVSEFDVHEAEGAPIIVPGWRDCASPADWPAILDRARRLDGYVARYGEERGARVAIALRSTRAAEKRYFETVFGPGATVIDYESGLSTYRAMDESEVTVALLSTAAIEAFGWGAKALFCNLSGHEGLSFPADGFFSLGECAYEEFRDRLDMIRSMDEPSYLKDTREVRRYVMAYDFEMPVHRLARGLVVEAIRKGPAPASGGGRDG
jgi:hypothetical protein